MKILYTAFNGYKKSKRTYIRGLRKILVKDFSRFSREYIYTKRYVEDNKK